METAEADGRETHLRKVEVKGEAKAFWEKNMKMSIGESSYVILPTDDG